MSSAFLILDLIRRNAGLKRERNARGSILPEFNDPWRSRSGSMLCR